MNRHPPYHQGPLPASAALLTHEDILLRLTLQRSHMISPIPAIPTSFLFTVSSASLPRHLSINGDLPLCNKVRLMVVHIWLKNRFCADLSLSLLITILNEERLCCQSQPKLTTNLTHFTQKSTTYPPMPGPCIPELHLKAEFERYILSSWP